MTNMSAVQDLLIQINIKAKLNNRITWLKSQRNREITQPNKETQKRNGNSITENNTNKNV